MKGREVKTKEREKESESITRGSENYVEQDRESEEDQQRLLAAKCKEGEKNKSYVGWVAGTEYKYMDVKGMMRVTEQNQTDY